MQIVYRILINFCIYFVYKIKRTTPAKFCIQSVYKSLSKCGIHFVYKHFLYILYTKVCPNMGYILYTFCIHFEYKMYTNVCRNVRYVLYTNILCTFCIHQFWSTESLHHKHYVYNFYTKIIQNVYTNNCIRYLDIFWLIFCAFPS